MADWVVASGEHVTSRIRAVWERVKPLRLYWVPAEMYPSDNHGRGQGAIPRRVLVSPNNSVSLPDLLRVGLLLATGADEV